MNVEFIPEVALKKKDGQRKRNDSQRQEQRHEDAGERKPPLSPLHAPHDRLERVGFSRVNRFGQFHTACCRTNKMPSALFWRITTVCITQNGARSLPRAGIQEFARLTILFL